MKFSHSFAAFLALLPILAQASPLDLQSGIRVGQPQTPAAKAPTAPKGTAPKPPAFPAKGPTPPKAPAFPAKASSAAAKGGNNAAATASKAAATAAAANNNDPQSSLTLLASVIAKGFENNGQDQPTAGQVASQTSSNNFINFCATVPNLPITNGQQIKSGSCNPAPMGVIASTSNMPSAKFVFPKNGQTIAANQDFTIQLAIARLTTGNFVNAQENYFAAPQTVDSSGNIVGHSHVVVEKLSALDQTNPTDPNAFAFFKGLNDKAVNGVLSADVAGGLPAGVYKLSTINSAANHQPVLVAVAQHGSLDDAIYFTVSAQGAAAASSAAAAPNATATVGAVRGANTGKSAGVQGGFASSKAATVAAAKPTTGFGKSGIKNRAEQ